MEKLQDFIKGFLIGKTLSNIEFYIIKPNYFSPDPENVWLIDGGVELEVEDQKISFGWWNEKDFYNIIPGPITSLTEDLEIENLEANNVQGIQSLLGQTIKDVKFEWNFYQELDEDFELIEEKKYMPTEIRLFFEKDFLQLSTVHCRLYDNEIHDLVYDSQGHLLISLNKDYQVQQVESEDEA